MKLDLTNDEARELAAALNVRLIEMREELVKTFDHAYRDDLKALLERLEVVQRRLEGELGKQAA